MSAELVSSQTGPGPSLVIPQVQADPGKTSAPMSRPDKLPAIDLGDEPRFQDEEDDNILDMSDDAPARKVESKAAPKPETPNPDPEPELEEAFKLPKVKEEEGEGETTVESSTPANTPKPANYPTKREYDKYPEIKDVLLKLPNHLYQKVTQEFDKLKANAAKANAYVYEHPESIVLDPVYRNLYQESSSLNFELDHYHQQKLAVENGDGWAEITGYDQNGAPVFQYHDPLPDGQIDTQARVNLERHLGQLQVLTSNKQAQLQGYQQNFAQRRAQATAHLDQVRSRLFSDLTPDKLSEADQKAIDTVKQLTPPAFHGHPLTEFLGYSFVRFQRLLSMYQTTMEENSNLKRQLGKRTIAQPSIPQKGGHSIDDEMIEIP